MNKTFSLFCFLLAFTTAKSQIDEPPLTRMNVTALAPLHFSIVNENDLFHRKTINNAIKLELKVKQESTIISAHSSFSLESPFQDKLLLKLSATNSPNVSASSNDIPLTNSPRQIFMQSRSNGGVKHYYYLFDLKLDPPSVYVTKPITNFYVTYTISLQ